MTAGRPAGSTFRSGRASLAPTAKPYGSDDFSVRLVASIPGRPTMLDLVLLAALSNRADQDLYDLARWIALASVTPVHTRRPRWRPR
jgi:hypothetical protein